MWTEIMCPAAYSILSRSSEDAHDAALSSCRAPRLRVDQLAHSAAMPRQKAYQDETVSPASSSFDQLRIGDPLAVSGGEKLVDPIAFLMLAAIVAPRELVKVAVKMLYADPVVDAEHLTLEVRPRTFEPVDVAKVPSNVFASTVIGGVMVKPAFQTDVASGFIARDIGAGLDVFNDLALDRLGTQIVYFHRPQIAVTFQHAEYSGLSGCRSCMLPPPFVLVAFLAADKGFVDFDHPTKRPVERFGLRGLAKPVRHEPSSLLSDADIASELGASDSFLVAGDQPDCDEPFAQRELRIFEDRSNLDRETLSAVAALMRLIIGEVVNLHSAAVRAERPVGPSDRAEMSDAALLVRESGGQFFKGVEVLQHARLQPRDVIYALPRRGSSSYINPIWAT
jgi:hypothetical protein